MQLFCFSGNSLPSHYLKEGHISPSLRLESIKHRHSRGVDDLGGVFYNTHRNPEELIREPVSGADLVKGGTRTPQDQEHGSRSDLPEWGSGATTNTEPKTQSDNKEWSSGDLEGTELDSERDPGAIQDIDLKAETGTTARSSKEWNFDASQDEEPAAENREWGSEDPEDMELLSGWSSVTTHNVEPKTENREWSTEDPEDTGLYSRWGLGATKEPEAETGNIEWSSENLKDAGLDSETKLDKRDTGNPEDKEPESRTEEPNRSFGTAQNMEEELQKQADLQTSVRSVRSSVDDPASKYAGVSEDKMHLNPKQFSIKGLKGKSALSSSADGDTIFVIQFPSQGKTTAPLRNEKKDEVKFSSPNGKVFNLNSVIQLNSVDDGDGHAKMMEEKKPEEKSWISVAEAVVGFSFTMIVLFVAFLLFAW